MLYLVNTKQPTITLNSIYNIIIYAMILQNIFFRRLAASQPTSVQMRYKTIII